jgi:hypothetical protein
MKISYKEIKSWKEFEDLIVAYFKQLKIEKGIVDVNVKPSGAGSDGGRDILVTFRINDSLVTFTRKWVIQCKFYNRNLKLSDIANINIPTLVHEYGANGYLLICKEHVSSGISKKFENLELNCKFKYRYIFWHGSSFLDKIITMDKLVKVYFPKFHAFTEKQEKKL